MNQYRSPAILAITLLISSFSVNASQELHRDAKGLVKQFGATLKPQLIQAMQQGGPVNAVDVCAIKAPEIARELSEQSGWNIRRVSLKNRNASAVADAWEQKVLKEFESQLAAGKPAKELERGELVDGEYRFMKAQVTTPLCLKCHGSNLAQPLHDKIKMNYPDDLALGYQAGEIRGAFSLSLKPVQP
ncbi:conserved hypothetical protein [Shewanella sediminis HAW-EB3]|uniref:Tll0287-like domain-containing protein n=1 Tax=Shewanella sediminis (strain HAW-EB3) TaxID=425104 RepID=A8G1R7_SHESH|nr:DUF3365 domain-containing protein [Shewanella sediminis]ABV39040.1 conserved hypothetical protein [Shewanella sediminis HAW-EB3]